MKKLFTWVLLMVVALGFSTAILAEADAEDSLAHDEIFGQYWIVRCQFEDAEQAAEKISESFTSEKPESLDEVKHVIQLVEDEEGQLMSLHLYSVTPDGIEEKESLDLLGEDESTTGMPEGEIVFETDDYTITITDYEILAPGEGANRFGSDYAIRFVYDVEIPEDGKSTSSAMAWTMSVEAIQNNNPNKVNKLNTAILYDASGAEAITDIAPGDKLTSSTGYILTDLETAVTIEFKTNRLNQEPDLSVDFPVQ